LLLTSCGTKEDLPPARTSVGLTMDGSRRIPLTGSVNQVSQTNALAQALSPEGWATGPVALPRPLGFAIAARSGKIFVYDDADSLERTIDLGDSVLIDQLLAKGDSLYAVGLSGRVWCVTPNGKQLWSNGPPQNDSIQTYVTANAVIADGALLVPCGKTLYSYAIDNGKPLTPHSFGLEIHSLASAPQKRSAAIALTRNQTGASDSLLILSGGRLKHGYELKEARFTSNLAVVSEDGDKLAYGYLGGMQGPQRTSAVALLEGVFDGELKQVWSHNVPYIVGHVAANYTDVIVGGFREQGGEPVSGIDAWRIEDTIHTWSRRFTEPVVAPFAVSDDDVYLHLSFSTDAIVETRGIFYTISAETGKTLREQAIPGATSGFLSHIPMPDFKGRFLLADRTRLLVYLLDRSSFERVFK
jgi:hypothetical protein